jgi:SNF2 family DNA or RNA helicase
MKLTAKNKKLVLYCDYSEREFPKSLKGRYEKAINAYTWPPSHMVFLRIIELADSSGIALSVDPRLIEHYSGKKVDYTNDGTYVSKTKAFDFQKTTIDYCVEKKRAIAMLDPGLGKSKCAIDSAGHFLSSGKVGRILIVSPNRLMANFANEIKTHSNFDATVISGQLKDRKYLLQNSHSTIHIINYDIISKLVEDIKLNHYDMVIFDEIHLCKSHTSIRSKAAYEIAKEIPHRIGLTGTAILNSPIDVFMIFKIIDERVFGTYITPFKSSYCVMGGFFDKTIQHTRREEGFHRLIASISIRFKLRDVAPQLPPEINEEVIVDLDESTMKAYKTAKDKLMIEFKTEDREGSRNIKNPLEKILRLRQIASGFTVDDEGQVVEISDEKISALLNIIEGIDGKVVVFCNYRVSIDRIHSRLNKEGISNMIFDGRTKPPGAGEVPIYNKFNNDDTKVFITQLSMGTGYSIPNCKYAVFFELSYSRGDYIQCRGRNLRIVGSEVGSCVYFHLMANKTIDPVILDVLKGKDFAAEHALRYVRGFDV